MSDDLWSCPECGRQFANLNQWHSCLELALDEHLASKSEHAVALYRAFEAAVGECGEFRMHPQKTRIAFIARMTFASATLARRWIDISFILPEPIGDARISSIDMYGPTGFGHHVRIHEEFEFDGAIRRWLCDAHRRGTQETLDRDAEVAPATGLALERLNVPLRATVVAAGDGLALAVPRYVSEVFDAHPEIHARISGESHPGVVDHQPGGRAVVRFAPSTLEGCGLGAGDGVDAFLRAAF